ncbi:MAG: serine/threonine protein kinase [Archangium sp.]|nr:serine/threonine protein kinase [Archangium sp.]
MSALEPGQLFAKDFQIERRLSQGGMGAVYVARQLSTDKLRALKLMHPQLVPDPRSRQRFVDEARIGGRIDSEHVVEVVAAGIDEASGAPWLAMELLEGEDLGSLSARRGAIPPGEVRDVFLQAGHALGLAHDQGIVHRDLKPENLFLARARREGAASVVKVLDFGLALALPSGGAGVVTSAVGSPFWMAPEQAKPGALLTPATDVWALGLMAFQFLTGGSYWRTAKEHDASIGAVLTEILVSPLEPASQRAASLGLRGVPDGFDAWFARCLAREPGERFPEARACLSELDALLARIAERVDVVASRTVQATAASFGLEATLQRTPLPPAAPRATDAAREAAPLAPTPAVAPTPVAAPASSGTPWLVLGLLVALAGALVVQRTLRAQPAAPTPPPVVFTPPAIDAGTVALAVDAGAPSADVLDAGASALARIERIDAGAPSTDVVDAGPSALAQAEVVDAGSNKTVEKHVRPPPRLVDADRVAGKTCSRGFVTVAEARAHAQRLCALLEQWDIARLAGGGSMDGPGYQCKVRERDPRDLGVSLCRR